MRITSTMLFSLVFLCTSATSVAQTPAGGMVGRVLDPAGATVPEATVQIRNVETNQVREAKTDGRGEFTVPNLLPGNYEVAVEKEGFRRLERKGLTLVVDQIARLELTLQLGAVSQVVEVQASAPLINTENSVKGDVMGIREMTEIPLGHDFAQFAFLSPGVLEKAVGAGGAQFAVNGARTDNTNFFIDGFNVQNPRDATILMNPPVESLAEFKIQTTGYPAEYGRLAGGVINMALKAGGNKVHGVFYGFFQQDVFNARDFFAADKPPSHNRTPGAQLDGPVVIPKLYDGHDRTFFLLTWNSVRGASTQSRLTSVPTQLERQGDFSQSVTATGAPVLIVDPLTTGNCVAGVRGACFPGNRIPADRISPIGKKIAAYFPLPNRPGQLNNYRASAINPAIADLFVYKIDHRVSSKDSLSVKFLQRYSDFALPWQQSDLGTFGYAYHDYQFLVGAGYTRTISPTMINELRVGYTRMTHHDNGPHAGHDYAAEFGIPNTTTDPRFIGFPKFNFAAGIASLGDPASEPGFNTLNNYQYTDTFTVVKARHTLKFGGDILRGQFFQPYYGNLRGTFTLQGVWANNPTADLLLGLLTNASRTLGTNNDYLFSTNYGFFAQDDIKVTPRLTLNLGLRYEILKPPVEKYGRITNFVPEIGKLIVADDQTLPNLAQVLASAGMTGKVGVARDFGLPKAIAYTNYRRLAPRFGLAWRPFGGTRTVLRGGYGIYYANSMSNPIRTTLGDVFPLVLSQTFNRVNNNPLALTLDNPWATTGTISGTANAAGYDLHAPPQYMQNWNLTLGRQLSSTTALEVSYIGSKGTHLVKPLDINQPLRLPEFRLPTGGFPRPIAGFNTINFFSFTGNSIYNAGTTTLRRGLARGLFGALSYTYSKSIDSASAIQGEGTMGYQGVQNIRNLKGERGRSMWDMGHVMTGMFTYDVPVKRNILLKQWQIGGSLRITTGMPFTVKTTSAQLDQGESDRPDRLAKGYVENRSPERWFDVTAFRKVPNGAYRFGNSGRSILDGPGKIAPNASLSRKIRIREKGTVMVRWEVYNVPNRPNFQLVNNDINSPACGTLTQSSGGRSMTFVVKYLF